MSAAKYQVKGIDVSHYQGDIDFEAIKDRGISFAFIKATEGSSHVDEMYTSNRSSAVGAELLCGFYHFFSLESSGKKQAKHFIETVGEQKGFLYPAVDVEYYGNITPNRNELLKELKVFMDILENEYGVNPILYSTTRFYNKYLKNEFPENPLWIRNVYFYSYKEWKFWQYSCKAEIDGYSGKEKCIDMNAFYGTPDELNNFIVK